MLDLLRRLGRLRTQEQNHTKARSNGIELLRSAAGKDCLWPISETTAAGRRVRLLRDGKTIAIAPRVDKPMLQRWLFHSLSKCNFFAVPQSPDAAAGGPRFRDWPIKNRSTRTSLAFHS